MKVKDTIEYDKYFYESYARLILKNICGFNLVNSDKPDLRNQELNLGIEVTRAIKTKDAEEQNIINKFFGKGYDAEYIKEKINCEYTQKGGVKDKIKILNDTICYNKEYSEIVQVELIKNCIVTKNQKLGKQIEMYKTNCLYIFIDTDLILEKSIYEIMKYSKENNITFDTIYINSLKRLFIIQLKDEEIICRYIPNETVVQIKEEAINEADTLRKK